MKINELSNLDFYNENMQLVMISCLMRPICRTL